VSYLRKARDTLRSRSMTRDSFARVIGQSATGGGFGKLIGAMSSYGLIETGKGRVTTTNLAEQIMYGGPEEQRKGRERSVRTVRVFDEIYRKFGGQPSDEQLRIFLSEKAGVNTLASESLAAEIGRLLTKNAVHVLPPGARAQPSELAVPSSSMEPVGRLEMSDYGILNIRDEISMDLAIDLLERVKKNREWTSRGRRSETRRPSTSARTPRKTTRRRKGRN